MATVSVSPTTQGSWLSHGVTWEAVQRTAEKESSDEDSRSAAESRSENSRPHRQYRVVQRPRRRREARCAVGAEARRQRRRLRLRRALRDWEVAARPGALGAHAQASGRPGLRAGGHRARGPRGPRRVAAPRGRRRRVPRRPRRPQARPRVRVAERARGLAHAPDLGLARPAARLRLRHPVGEGWRRQEGRLRLQRGDDRHDERGFRDRVAPVRRDGRAANGSPVDDRQDIVGDAPERRDLREAHGVLVDNDALLCDAGSARRRLAGHWQALDHRRQTRRC